MNGLPQKLYGLRKSRGLLQEELAEKLGVSRQAISKWEMGTGVPTLENLIGISDFFGVTLDSLVKDEHETMVNIANDKPTDQICTESDTAPPSKPTVAHKIIVNVITVIVARVVMLCISQFIIFIMVFIQNSLSLNGISSSFMRNLFSIMEYILDMLTLLPYYYILYMIFFRNKSLLSRPLFDKSDPLSKRDCAKKVLLVFLMRVFFDVSAHVLIIRFSLDITWMNCTTILEHFLMYAIFTHGKPSIFQNAKYLIMTALISVSTYAVAAIMSFYQVHILLNAFTVAYMTYPLTYSVLLHLMNYAIVCAFVIFHGIWVDKKAK